MLGIGVEELQVEEGSSQSQQSRLTFPKTSEGRELTGGTQCCSNTGQATGAFKFMFECREMEFMGRCVCKGCEAHIVQKDLLAEKEFMYGWRWYALGP